MKKSIEILKKQTGLIRFRFYKKKLYQNLSKC